jgi:hypothetical protein
MTNPAPQPPQEPPGPPQGQGWQPPPPGNKWPPSRIIALGIVGALLLLAAIGALSNNNQQPSSNQPTTAEVEVRTEPVDMCWSGAFGDRTVDGCGDSIVTVESDIGIYSVTAQKKDDSLGTLALILRINGKEVDSTSTSAAYGVASVSGQDE